MGQGVTAPTIELRWPFSTKWGSPTQASSFWPTVLAISPSPSTQGPPLMGEPGDCGGVIRAWPGAMQSGWGSHGAAPQSAGQHLGEKLGLPRLQGVRARGP